MTRPSCGGELEPSETELEQGWFRCPVCAKWVGLGKFYSHFGV